MIQFSMVQKAYGVRKVSDVHGSQARTTDDQQPTASTSYVSESGEKWAVSTTGVPIFLSTAYSNENALRTYRNVMDSADMQTLRKEALDRLSNTMSRAKTVEAESARELQLTGQDTALPKGMLDRLLNLSMFYKAAETSGNLQAMRAAYDEAQVIRKQRYIGKTNEM